MLLLIPTGGGVGVGGTGVAVGGTGVGVGGIGVAVGGTGVGVGGNGVAAGGAGVGVGGTGVAVGGTGVRVASIGLGVGVASMGVRAAGVGFGAHAARGRIIPNVTSKDHSLFLLIAIISFRWLSESRLATCAPSAVQALFGQHCSRIVLWSADSARNISIGNSSISTGKADAVFVFNLFRRTTTQIVELVTLLTADVSCAISTARTPPHIICQDFGARWWPCLWCIGRRDRCICRQWCR